MPWQPELTVIISVVVDSGNEVVAKEEDTHVGILKLLPLMPHNRPHLLLATNVVRQDTLPLSAQTMALPVAVTPLLAPPHSAHALLHPLVDIQPPPKMGNPVGQALPIPVEVATTTRHIETLWFAWHVPFHMNT